MRIAALLATRKGSVRIKNKSLKTIGNYNLTTLKIQQILKSKIFSNFYFSSDIEELNNYAEKRGAIIIRRPKKFLGKSTISSFGPFLVKHIVEENICYLTNTSPLLKISTIIQAVKKYKKLDFKKYDSLSSFEVCKEFLWDKKKPINYNIKKQPRSQDLDKVYIFNPAISIIKKNKLIEFQNVIGRKPFKFIISKPESIDVDTIYDYELAKIFFKGLN